MPHITLEGDTDVVRTEHGTYNVIEFRNGKWIDIKTDLPSEEAAWRWLDQIGD
jgi:hypothetical protein